MPVRSDEPLRRVTLNLYEEDCAWLEMYYGHGWTERVRQHIHNEVVTRMKFTNDAKPRRTLGDLVSGYEHKDPMWPDDLGDDTDDSE